MIKNLKSKILYIFILIMVFMPSLVQAIWTKGTPLVPACKNDKCGFGDLVLLVSNIIDFIIYISVSVSAVMFAYAGFLYITAQGETGKIQSAHSIFKNVGLGLVFVLGAWLIVKAVLSGMGLRPEYILLG